jgi:uncharacterized protein
MLNLKYPGVYTQEVPSGVRTISAAPTSVALFVGPTKNGIDNRRTRIQSFSEFERNFGGLARTSSLSYSVLHFFSNGGGEAFVLRVPVKEATRAVGKYKRMGTGNALSFQLEALSSGAAGNDIMVEIDWFGIDAKPFASLQDKKKFNLTITDRQTGRSERFTKLTTSADNGRFAEKVINDIGTGSKLVSMSLTGNTSIGGDAPQMTGTTYSIGTPPTADTTPIAKDEKVKVSLSVLLADGNADTVNSLAGLEVTALPKGSLPPGTPQELANRLAKAINAEIRKDPSRVEKMQGMEVEVAPFEGGSLLRLRVSEPGPGTLKSRMAEATVTLDPSTAGSEVSDLMATYKLTLAGSAILSPGLKAPSRYFLGSRYGTDSGVAEVPVQSGTGTVDLGKEGDPSGQPDTTIFKNAIMALDDPDPFFNILCLPDVVRPAANDPNALHHAEAMTMYSEAARVCKNKHAFLLIDPPPNVKDAEAAEFYKSSTMTFQSSHAAAYFPNIRVDDPLESGAMLSHAPSGALAGLFARTDAQFGVWQAPAGTEASLSGVYGPSVELSDDQHGILNPIGLNCIRKFPIYQTVCFGSRTVDGANALGSEWKYIPVRRTASFILRSLSEGLRWAVHKPNGEQLWSQLRLNANGFMHNLFRQGAFKGTSAREAYFVQCDASTTSADDINQGVVNIVVGFAPLKPAEFVVISLRQIVQPLV